MAFYNEPFDVSCIEGWISWDKLDYRGQVYHACTLDSAKAALEAGEVACDSQIEYRTAKKITKNLAGFWGTLNYYNDGFDFGPVAFRWPREILSGLNFLVLRGKAGDSHRWAFVQAKTTGNELSRDDLFDIQPDGDAWLRTDHVYNLVLTRPLSVATAGLVAVGERGGLGKHKAAKKLVELGTDYLNRWLSTNDDLRRQIARFPDLAFHRFTVTAGADGPIPALPSIDLED